MHLENFDPPKREYLHALIDEYGRMERLEGFTAQTRGQRLNGFVRDLLQCWGLERVEANVRSVGEIDVTFVVDGIRCVLEAKWEQPPIPYDPLAKLRGRISQRLTGTRGVFISMSGYTAEGRDGILRGHQPDILLLDRSHLEAMLSGLLSPQELFSVLIDRASFRGEVYTPLAELVPADVALKPPPLLPGPPNVMGLMITPISDGVRAETVLHTSDWPRTVVDGLAIDAQGRLLLTMPEGVARVDLGSGKLGWAVPLSGCRSAVLPRPDGSFLVIRGAAVLRWDGSGFMILAGGFTGNAVLLGGPDNEVWMLDYHGSPRLPDISTQRLTRLGGSLGQEQRYFVNGDIAACDGVWLAEHRFFLIGENRYVVVDVDKTTQVIAQHYERELKVRPHLRGTTRLGDQTIMFAGRPGTVYRQDEAGQITPVMRHNASDFRCELVAGPNNHVYLLTHLGEETASRPMIVAISGH